MAPRRGVPLGLKLEIIDKHENGVKNSELAAQYKVHHSTISMIIKRKSDYKEKVLLPFLLIKT